MDDKKVKIQWEGWSDKKFILDVTCGVRSIWFNKNHPNALYLDIRKEEKGFIQQGASNYEVNPDMIMDFRDLKFPDKSFKLVIWDPPHLKNLSRKSWIRKKYGSLSEEWENDIKKGFKECYRVLDDFGILVFKWSCCADGRKNRDITISQVLKVIPVQPIVGHTTGSKSNTMWMCFMKIPEEKELKKWF